MKLLTGLVIVINIASVFAADLPRDLFENKCLSCHHPDKAKGGLDLSTREKFLLGGDAGPAIDIERPERSEILIRVRLPHDDEDLMPPEGKGKPLTDEECEKIEEWIKAGATWPAGLVLQPADPKAMPPHDAENDPQIKKIEAFPNAVILETSSDFHQVRVMATFADAAVRDITRQVKYTLVDPSLADLNDSVLTPKKTAQRQYKSIIADYKPRFHSR